MKKDNTNGLAHLILILAHYTSENLDAARNCVEKATPIFDLEINAELKAKFEEIKAMLEE